jgi:hypothetical protein
LDDGNRFKLRQERHISLLTELEMLCRRGGYKYFAPDGASPQSPAAAISCRGNVLAISCRIVMLSLPFRV